MPGHEGIEVWYFGFGEVLIGYVLHNVVVFEYVDTVAEDFPSALTPNLSV